MIIGSAIRFARARAARHTERDRYSPVGMAFHWGIAALVFFQIGWGLRMSRLPAGLDKFQAYDLHVQTGLLILVLVLARMLWRILIPGPVNDADKPGIESTLAHLTHYAFYFLLITLPLTGWAMRSTMAREIPMSVAGVMPWPHLPFGGFSLELRQAIMMWAERGHWFLVWSLMLLIVAHVGAALKHHFLDRDDVLAGMLPLVRHPDDMEPGELRVVARPARLRRRRSRSARDDG